MFLFLFLFLFLFHGSFYGKSYSPYNDLSPESAGSKIDIRFSISSGTQAQANPANNLAMLTEKACTNKELEKICPKPKAEKTAKISTTREAQPASEIDGQVCKSAQATAVECCSNPVSCLGGEKLATFNTISNVVGTAGPGLTMAAQSLKGEGMRGICQAIQSLTAGNAGLSASAAMKCKSKISSCKKACDKQVKQNCELYQKAKENCKTNHIKADGKKADVKTTFDGKAKDFLDKIQSHETSKKDCVAQSGNATKLFQDMGQMANSAMAAEACKMQASNLDDEEDCDARSEEEGCRWTGSECKCTNPDEGKTPAKPLADNRRSKFNAGTNQEVSLASVPDSSKKTEKTDENGPAKEGSVRGGGGTEKPNNNPIQLPNAGGEPLADEGDSTADTENKTANNSAFKLSGSSGGFGSRRGYYSGRRQGENNEDSSIPSLGGGGFSGYGGGGGDDDDSATVSLGLSKKKLKELEKKQGAKRGTAGKMLGSSHQNIFERISKRFQSLCQSKINCN